MKSHGNWRVNLKDWGLRIGLVLLAALWLALMAGAWAEAAKGDEIDRKPAWERAPAAASSGDEGGEYNFNWLDPDKKIYVLQNRKYVKAGHVILSATAGPGWSNPYRTIFTVDPRFAYYMSEAFGIEAFYIASFNSANSTAKALDVASPNTQPTVREIKGEYGALLHWVPWYAKINVFNQILYFDWYFAGGVGSIHSQIQSRLVVGGPVSTVTDDRFGIFLGTGHEFHVSQSFIVRLDVTGAYYQAPINGTAGETSWYSNYKFGAGIGFKL